VLRSTVKASVYGSRSQRPSRSVVTAAPGRCRAYLDGQIRKVNGNSHTYLGGESGVRSTHRAPEVSSRPCKVRKSGLNGEWGVAKFLLLNDEGSLCAVGQRLLEQADPVAALASWQQGPASDFFFARQAHNHAITASCSCRCDEFCAWGPPARVELPLAAAEFCRRRDIARRGRTTLRTPLPAHPTTGEHKWTCPS
jgi:hypothetical protein